MALSLSIGDAVLVYNHNHQDYNEKDHCMEHMKIGLIKYIGYIDNYDMTQYVGIELVEPIEDGHNGTINSCDYFDCPEGYGIHTKITNVIRKLSAPEVTIKMQEVIMLFKSRLDEYVQALSQRDEYIEELKNKQRYLRDLFNDTQTSTDRLLSNYHPKNMLSLAVPKKKSKKQMVMNVAPFDESEDTSIPDTSLIVTDSSDSAVHLHNINKKSFVLTFTDSNKPSIEFNPTEILRSSSCEESDDATSNESNDNKTKKANKRKKEYTKRTQAIKLNVKQSETEECVFESDTEPTVTPETDWSDNEYDGNSSSDGGIMSKYSKLSQHSSKHKLQDIETVPSLQPQQHYAYSHITYNQMQKQKKSMNEMTYLVPSLQYTSYNKSNPCQQSVGLQVISNNDPQCVPSRRASWNIINGGNNGLISNHHIPQKHHMMNYGHPQHIMTVTESNMYNVSSQASPYINSQQYLMHFKSAPNVINNHNNNNNGYQWSQ